MAERADVAIIGAGVVGTSVAFQLARLGAGAVLLLEKEALPGTGSTAKANGGIRAQFTTDVNVAMSLASMEILDALAPEIGDPPIYRKAGYLFLTGDPKRLAAMEAGAAFQRARGVSVEVLDADGVRARAPFAAGPDRGRDLRRARRLPRPGRPHELLPPRGVAFRRAGRSTARACRRSRARAAGFLLKTDAGDVAAGAVVIAAGPWTGRVAALAGVDVPVEPVRRHIFVSGPCPGLPPVIPMTIDADSGVLVRREGNRVAIAWSNADEPPGFNTAFDPDFFLRFGGPLETRFPSIAAAGLDLRMSWAGLYEVTPDHHAVLGPAAEVPGLFVASGFSGHGVMHAPAAGRAVAEMILRGRSETVDVRPLALDRFRRGALIHETMVL